MSNDIILKSLDLKNFRSFSNEFVRFSSLPDENLVEGINEDAGGLESNGSGKSTIFIAVHWILFGSAGLNISQRDLVKNFEDDCSGSLTLGIDKNIYRIIRKLRGGAQNLKIQLYENESWTNLSERLKSQTQNRILELLGFGNISIKEAAEDFQRMIIINSDTIDVLASNKISPAQRLAFVGRLLGLERLKKARELSLSLRKPLKDDRDRIQAQINAAKEYILTKPQIKNLQTLITESENKHQELIEHKKEVQRKIRRVEELESVNTQAADLLKQVESLKKSRDDSALEFQRNILRVDKAKHDLEDAEIRSQALAENIEETKKTIKNITAKSNEINVNPIEKQELSNKKDLLSSEYTKASVDLRNNEQQLKNTILCPACNHPLMLHKSSLQSLDVNVIKKAAEENRNELIRLMKDLETIDSALQSIKDKTEAKEVLQREVEEEQERLHLFEKQHLTLTAELTKIDSYDTQRKEYKELLDKSNDTFNQSIAKLITKYNELLESIETIPESKTNLEKEEAATDREIRDLIVRKTTMESKINSSEGAAETKKRLVAAIDQNKDRLEKLEFWTEHFTKLTNLMIATYINEFQDLSTEFLRQMDSNLSVDFRTTKDKQDGGIKSEFHINVVDTYMDTHREIESYSDGERKRIAIAIALAARMIANRNRKTFAFLVLDEIFDGLDVVGKTTIRSVLNKITGQKFIITHSTEMKQLFFSRLIVKKEDGNSTIVRSE